MAADLICPLHLGLEPRCGTPCCQTETSRSGCGAAPLTAVSASLLAGWLGGWLADSPRSPSVTVTEDPLLFDQHFVTIFSPLSQRKHSTRMREFGVSACGKCDTLAAKVVKWKMSFERSTTPLIFTQKPSKASRESLAS